MQVIIVTAPGDMDAIAFELYMRNKNIDIHRVFFSEIGLTTTLNFTLPEYKCEISTVDGNILSSRPAVVWLRKPRPPQPTKNDIFDQHDSSVVHAENVYAAHTVLHSLCKHARTLNSFVGRDAGRAKTLQLENALEAGFTIPKTLITNKKSEVLNFIAENKNSTVMKTFGPVQYREDNTHRIMYTAEISATDLDGEPDYLDQPSIFQQRVEKSSEIRALFLGGYVIAVELATQENVSTQVDSRRAVTVGVTGKVHTLPHEVKAKAINLMKSLNVQTASFDLIITPEGDYVFLEFNETGQCLYLEEYEGVPSILDAYSQFLTFEGDPFDFQPTALSSKIDNLEIYHKAHTIARDEFRNYQSKVSQVSALRL